MALDLKTVLLPAMLVPADIEGRFVVVFDVLRATTSINTALSNGAKEVRVFDSLNSAKESASQFDGEKLLAGERNCLPPDGFDLGNSPCEFQSAKVKDRTIFLSTSNGTRALVAARAAQGLFAGSIANALAVAELLWQHQFPTTFLCAGTNGVIAPEDAMGAGYVAAELVQFGSLSLDENSAVAMKNAPTTADARLGSLLNTDGARNIIAAGLDRDIACCAALNSIDIVGQCNTKDMILQIARL